MKVALSPKEKIAKMVAQFEGAAARMAADTSNPTWATKARTILNANAFLGMVDVQQEIGPAKEIKIRDLDRHCMNLIRGIELTGTDPADSVREDFLRYCQEMADILKS